MPLSPAGVAQVPNYWTIFGHSYFQYTFGTRQQNGRADSIFRNLLNVDHTSFANFAVNGARLITSGLEKGSWPRLLNNVSGVPPSTGDNAPYIAGGGSYLLGWGINDLGFNGNTAQFNTAYGLAMQAVISRCRASTIRLNNYAGGAGTGTIAYGSGFTNLAGLNGDRSSGSTLRQCTTTGVNATFTITLPSDYNGEAIAICYIAQPGVLGGTITYSGTAGVTGTISTSNIQPAASLSHSVLISRITNLTSANASQTIIGTVSAIDAGGTVFFDSFWLEADNPPPVLVCNTARLLAAGYLTPGYFGGMADSDVVTFNAVLPPVIAQFDGMVQMVDLDSALNKDSTLFSPDGLHPNELGAAKISDAILAAVRRLPANRWGVAAAIQPPSPRTSAMIMPNQIGQWYTAQSLGGVNGTAYTAVSGDQYAIPFEITAGTARFTKWAVELVTSTVATSIFAAIYDDRRYRGYPQQLYFALQNTTAQVLATGAGVQQFTPAFNIIPDPGLYWLVLKVVTAGTTTFRTIKGPSLFMPNLTTAGAGGTTPAGWFIAGQGTGVMPGTFVTGAALADNCPMVGLLAG